MISIQYVIAKQNIKATFQSTMQMSSSLLTEQRSANVTFRSCRKEAGIYGLYQKRMFILMGLYLITASCFLVLPFFIFKKQKFIGCEQFDSECIKKICSLSPEEIIAYVEPQYSLTYKFKLYCNDEYIRVVYKMAPQAVSFIGLLIYGFIADSIGRKIAFKISWRFYAMGLIFFTTTETQFLISFGYFFACVNCFPSLVVQFILLFQQVERVYRLRACLLLLVFLFVGPLFGAFLAPLMLAVSLKLTLLVLCTVPALILSFATGYLQQSAVFVYKQDKFKAFTLVNKIAKINKIPPILIDFGRSSWIHYEQYTYSYLQILKNKLTKKKCTMGILFMFTFFLNTKVAQKSLDDSTQSQLRGQLMNAASALGTLLVVLVLVKCRMRSFTQLMVGMTAGVTLVRVSLLGIGQVTATVEIVMAVNLRLFSSVSYSAMVIWVMEAFPTVCRAKCLALVLSACSFATILVSLAFTNDLALFTTALFFNLIVLLSFHQLEYPHHTKLADTLNGEYYDTKDYFYKFN